MSIAIPSLFPAGPPVIVGIAGGSASGKTTFTAALVASLQACIAADTGDDSPARIAVFHLDQYARTDRTQGPSFLFSATGETIFNMNHPDAFEVERLRAEIDALAAADEGQQPAVIIVEGLMVLHHPLLRERLDLRLFLELDADQRALRRMLRDLSGGRGSRDPQFIAAYYAESARVGHALYVEPSRIHADLILRGDGDFSRLAAIVTTIVASGNL